MRSLLDRKKRARRITAKKRRALVRRTWEGICYREYVPHLVREIDAWAAFWSDEGVQLLPDGTTGYGTSSTYFPVTR